MALLAPVHAATDGPLRTQAEDSGFKRTGRYSEVIALCDAFARRYPDSVRCTNFGTSPEGRPMHALIVSRAGAFSPEAARTRNLPVLLVQGGIHAGEIDGKDAGFIALRQMLDGDAAPGALEKQVVVFVPVFNVDGHERFGRWGRPNQVGPEETGWRTTAQNYNLNRDYLKADAPEMRAMLRLIDTWDPIAYMDLHVTNGAKFEHDISIQVEPLNSGDAQLRRTGRALRETTIAALAAQGALPLPFYPSFVDTDNPQSGFADSVPPPRFSHGYMPLRNRFGMLVETHSWRPYAHRVKLTRDTIVSVAEQVAADGTRWRQQARDADERAMKLGGDRVPLDYRTEDTPRSIDFRGYAYTRTQSEVSGALMTRYDDSKPQVWNVPLRDSIVPGTVITAPKAGYIVPAQYAAEVGALLDVHGVAHRRIDTAIKDVKVESFRATKAEAASGSSEGHQRMTLAGEWRQSDADIAGGSLYVPLAQAKSRIAIALLEPNAPDALVAWGMFNTAFERKEYMEDYVAEDVARTMLKDKSIRAEFERRLASDPAFAKDPQARLEFFYRRHPAWDVRYNLYPVYRVDRAPR